MLLYTSCVPFFCTWLQPVSCAEGCDLSCCHLHLCWLLPGRSLGDLTAATVGCTSDPEVSFTTLRPGVDHVLVMATDGVWDVLTNEQVCDIVVESPDPHIACR